MIDAFGRAVVGVDPGMLFWDGVINSFLAAVLGILVSYIYKYVSQNKTYSSSFFQVIIAMSILVCFVMMIIGSNIARAFSLVGALSIIRFRTAVKDAKDTMYIFFSMVVGMACGVGYKAMAIYATLFIGSLFLLLNKSGIAGGNKEQKRLKINFAEDENVKSEIEKILNQYCTTFTMHTLTSVKQGTLFEAIYVLELVKNSSAVGMLAALKTANGNEKVALFDYL